MAITRVDTLYILLVTAIDLAVVTPLTIGQMVEMDKLSPRTLVCSNSRKLFCSMT